MTTLPQINLSLNNFHTLISAQPCNKFSNPEPRIPLQLRSKPSLNHQHLAWFFSPNEKNILLPDNTTVLLVRGSVFLSRKIIVSSLCTYPVIRAHFLYSDFVLLTTSVITFIRVTEEGDPLEGHLYTGSNHVQIFSWPYGHPTVTGRAPGVTSGIQSVNLQNIDEQQYVFTYGKIIEFSISFPCTKSGELPNIFK